MELPTVLAGKCDCVGVRRHKAQWENALAGGHCFHLLDPPSPGVQAGQPPGSSPGREVSAQIHRGKPLDGRAPPAASIQEKLCWPGWTLASWVWQDQDRTAGPTLQKQAPTGPALLQGVPGSGLQKQS